MAREGLDRGYSVGKAEGRVGFDLEQNRGYWRTEESFWRQGSVGRAGSATTREGTDGITRALEKIKLDLRLGREANRLGLRQGSTRDERRMALVTAVVGSVEQRKWNQEALACIESRDATKTAPDSARFPLIFGFLRLIRETNLCISAKSLHELRLDESIENYESASCTIRSDSASRALVASSSSNILGFLRIARATAILCF
ncbi:hypothetical protein M5K25_011117 [Dendrobium thyrsiflorum]|uniref:Uncharacterized protein n=1 Tax=Dendrobium thyrsiflorum TaxID=117978 RepID=A0ABD0V1Z6_DENTH